MTNTPPEPHRASEIDKLNTRRPSHIHSSAATNSPHSNTSEPKQTFNPDGTRKYLNIRPAGGQPFPLKKGEKYLAKDFKDGVEVKKGKGATSSAEKRRAESNRAVGSASAMLERERVDEQEAVAISGEPSSLDLDSSPERPLIEVLRSIRRDGERVESSASGEVGMGGEIGEESEDDRGRKMVRDVGRRGGTRDGK